MPYTHKKNCTIWLDEELINEIAAMAKKLGVTKTNLMERCVVESVADLRIADAIGFVGLRTTLHEIKVKLFSHSGDEGVCAI
jgi:hypothetical protein